MSRGRNALAAATVTVGLALTVGCAGRYQQVADGIPSDHTIRPTAIVLHWWGSTSNGDVRALVNGLRGQTGYYDPNITKAQYDFNVAHQVNGHPLGVQVGITRGGGVYQLTPQLNSYAAHAACANPWAVGIEIEASGPADLRSDPAQFEAVVNTTADLMRRYAIPLDGVLAPDGRSGTGVHSHKQVDVNCKFADGVYAGQGKDDVDDEYLAMVKAAITSRGL